MVVASRTRVVQDVVSEMNIDGALPSDAGENGLVERLFELLFDLVAVGDALHAKDLENVL
jgi:hypothetical protein